MSRKITVLLVLLASLISPFSPLTAEPTENKEDIVCAALLPCSPPAFEVFEGFKTGPCALVYKTACAKWREIKAKADALDLAVQKLIECQDSKNNPKSKKKAKK